MAAIKMSIENNNLKLLTHIQELADAELEQWNSLKAAQKPVHDLYDGYEGEIFREIALAHEAALEGRFNLEQDLAKLISDIAVRHITLKMADYDPDEAMRKTSLYMMQMTVIAVRAEMKARVIEDLHEAEKLFQKPMGLLDQLAESHTQALLAYGDKLSHEQATRTSNGGQKRQSKNNEVRQYAISLYENAPAEYSSASEAAKLLAQDVLNYAKEIGAQKGRDFQDVFQVRDTVKKWINAHLKKKSASA